MCSSCLCLLQYWNKAIVHIDIIWTVTDNSVLEHSASGVTFKFQRLNSSGLDHHFWRANANKQHQERKDYSKKYVEHVIIWMRSHNRSVI